MVFMFKGVLNWAPYWQFHFGEGGGFQIGHPIGSFILGREGDFKLGTLLAVSFWGGKGFQIGYPIGSFILGREGVSNRAPY